MEKRRNTAVIVRIRPTLERTTYLELVSNILAENLSNYVLAEIVYAQCTINKSTIDGPVLPASR